VTEEIKLTDINHSKSATPGILLFFRLVPCEQFNMTSGVSMPFPGQVEEHLLTVVEQVNEKVTSHHKDVIRFRTFFEMYRKYGYNATYV